MIKIKKQDIQNRSNSIGGSDVPTLLGVNNYKCSGELFLEKVGITEPQKFKNLAIEMGHILEPIAVDFWQYYNFDSIENLLQRKEANQKIYTAISYPKRIENTNYPNIACHLDSLYSKTGKIDKTVGVLEVKNKSSYVTKNWINGIPPQDFVQLQTYLMITEIKVGQVCVMIDARDLIVQEYIADKDLHQEIETKCKDFWSRVLKARLVWLSSKNAIEKMKLIRELEPEVDISPRWYDWLKDSYKPNPGEILEGNSEILEVVKQYKEAHEHLNEIQSEKNYYESQIKRFMGEAVSLDFGDKGSVSWKLEGKNRVFRVKLKEII